jgi:hypothetical protein
MSRTVTISYYLQLLFQLYVKIHELYGNLFTITTQGVLNNGEQARLNQKSKIKNQKSKIKNQKSKIKI